MIKRFFTAVSVFVAILSMTVACSKGESQKPGLVVYTSVDQNISEMIFEDFERETGIDVLPVYDIEASKTTGLVNRIIAERDNPQADVFWSSEIIMTLRLKDEGLLKAYVPHGSSMIPESYKDDEGYWTGFGGRARVMIVNREYFPNGDYPASVYDLMDERYMEYKKALAYPMFGTSMTHMFVMNEKWGEKDTLEYFVSSMANNTLMVDGNSVVRDMVVSGDAAFGITDTDDAFAAVSKGSEVEVMYLDQDGQGTLLIPNTVSLVEGCRNEADAKVLIDYLISESNVDRMIEEGFIDVSLIDENIGIKLMECDFEKAYSKGDYIFNLVKEKIVR